MFSSITWQQNLLVYILFQERIGSNGRTTVKEFITHLPALRLFSLCLNSFNNVMSFFKMSKWSTRWRCLAYHCIYKALSYARVSRARIICLQTANNPKLDRKWSRAANDSQKPHNKSIIDQACLAKKADIGLVLFLRVYRPRRSRGPKKKKKELLK